MDRSSDDKSLCVLVMCTANRGRSPLAAAMLRRMLAERGMTERIRVESAGMSVHELGRSGYRSGALIRAIAKRHGLDLEDHRARPLDATQFELYDLVIVMEAWQSHALRQCWPERGRRVFTLRELGGESDDPNTPDVAGVPEAQLEIFMAEARRCLDAGLRTGPLGALAGAGGSAP